MTPQPFQITQLQQLLWSMAQDTLQTERGLAAWQSRMAPYVLAGLVTLVVLAMLFFFFSLVYRPRIPRGGLWTPMFGLFGATPKLYYHTRPPSLFGVFLRTRHRVFSFTKSKSH